MRLFIAIEISPEVRATLASLIKEFRGAAPQAKWVRAENMHITLKFLGETKETKLPAIQEALRTIRSSQAVALCFLGLGFFPNEKRAKVFWAGIQSSANLPAIAADIDKAVHELGFPLENRAFTPHLTLARFEPPGIPANLFAAAENRSAREIGSLIASEFHLIESKLKPTGAEYTTLQSFPFVAEV